MIIQHYSREHAAFTSQTVTAYRLAGATSICAVGIPDLPEPASVPNSNVLPDVIGCDRGSLVVSAITTHDDFAALPEVRYIWRTLHDFAIAQNGRFCAVVPTVDKTRGENLLREISKDTLSARLLTL